MCILPDEPEIDVQEEEEDLDPAVKQAREDQKKKARASAGLNSTILTGSSGLAPANTGGKTLLGQ